MKRDRETSEDKIENILIRDLARFRDLYPLIHGGMSIKAAADHLGTRKGTALEMLRRLEEVLLADGNRQLVDRESGVDGRPTDDGDRLLRFAEDVLARIHAAAEALKVGKSVRVMGTEAAIGFFLPKVFKQTDFLVRYRQTDITIEEGSWWDIMEALRKNRIDFGIAYTANPPVDTDLVEVERVLNLKRMLVYHINHVFRAGNPGPRATLDHVRRETLLTLNHRITPVTRPEELFPLPVFGEGRLIKLPSLTQIYTWVKNDLGVAVIHEGFMEPNDEKVLRTADISEFDGSLAPGIYLYFTKGMKPLLNPASQYLVECIYKALSKPRSNT